MKCVLCGNSYFKIIQQKIRFNFLRKVVQCKNCKLVSLKNPNTDIIDYEKTYRKLHSPILNKQMSSKEFFKFQEKFQPSKISRVNHLLKKNYDVLEIGSSTGNFLNSIKNLVNCSVGIELDKKHMEFSKKHCKLEVYNKPIEKLKLDQKFDIIFMFQVFEHIPNPIEFLNITKQFLKSSGRIYVEVPNIDDALNSVYGIQNFKNFYFRLPHPYYYSENTLTKVFQKAGFIGKSNFFQQYSVFNHINWILTHKLQASQIDGYSDLLWDSLISNSEKKEILIQKFFKKFNSEYKNLLENNGLTENLSFTGKIKKV